VYHRATSATPWDDVGFLNLTDSWYVGGNPSFFGNTAPTSTNFTVGTSLNNSGDTYVAYLFAHNAGGFGLTGTDNVISCGSYVGSGSSGTTVNLGWEPQWVMIKKAADPAGNGPSGWVIMDNMRGLGKSYDNALTASASTSEAGDVSVSNAFELQSTGFKLLNANGALNVSTDTYIYIAIRRGPMKVPTLGTTVFNALTYTGTGSSSRKFTGVGFPPDAVIPIMRISPGNHMWGDRLRGTAKLDTTSTNEGDNGYVASYDQDGWTVASDAFGNNNTYTFVTYLMRRAAGFFDVVCYNGTGASSQTKTHNLGVTPELMIIKCRGPSGYTQPWTVYPGPLGTDKYMFLNTTAAAGTFGSYWADTPPTSTGFTVGNYQDTNASTLTYVAYLFATCAGVSKVGSYTGTGTTLQVNCGFTGGARFVLIKRTDSTGDWYVWDTVRGIISGNDPYLLMNSTAAEVTNTDYIDSYSPGFELSSTAPAAINANGGTYIFLAIA
jgi:hypothetical protein